MVASAAITLILLGAALSVGYQRWMDTRTFSALNQPALLSPGRVSTQDFEVNLSGWYQIGVDFDERPPYSSGCGFGASDPLLKARSIIYSDGRAVAQTDGADRFLGHFYAVSQKKYRLEIDVLSDASCLNAYHPRVFVWTPSLRYDILSDDLQALSFVLVIAGVGILAFSTTLRRSLVVTPPEDRAINNPPSRAYCPTRRKHLLRQRFSQPPPFALIYSLVLLDLVLLGYLFLATKESIGIEVHLAAIGPLKTTSAFQIAPLVHMESMGADARARLLFDSKPIAWEALEPALKADLKPHAVWVVYLEADTDVSWQDVMNAADIVRGIGGKVVLLTKVPSPRSKRSSR